MTLTDLSDGMRRMGYEVEVPEQDPDVVGRVRALVHRETEERSAQLQALPIGSLMALRNPRTKLASSNFAARSSPRARCRKTGAVPGTEPKSGLFTVADGIRTLPAVG